MWSPELSDIKRHGDNFVFLESHVLQCFSFILGPRPRHMEVPRLGVKSELQLPAYTTATAIWTRATSVTYIIAHGNARSLTH